MLFTEKSMTDFEKLQFTEGYIVELKKALRIYEENELNYTKNIEEIIEIFRNVSPEFQKVHSYLRELKTHRTKVIQAERKAEKLEAKNYQYRLKIRGLEAIIKKEEQIKTLSNG